MATYYELKINDIVISNIEMFQFYSRINRDTTINGNGKLSDKGEKQP